jgi:hypothetical protein
VHAGQLIGSSLKVAGIAASFAGYPVAGTIAETVGSGFALGAGAVNLGKTDLRATMNSAVNSAVNSGSNFIYNVAVRMGARPQAAKTAHVGADAV